ncbi:cytochrome C1 precursor [Theileria orientalis]|uniref:Cytochrome C1 n=1 Tax=Theileria orientalis TaxID=68886 RepID=A0A976QSM9_THEOR|nr:cytochrome C1 precursor [Theileria orientalis]
MAGGGALNKLFPGYKDKIWNRLPVRVRYHLINSWNRKLVSSAYSESVLTNSKIKSFNKFVLDPLKPSYAYRSPAIDYKKQRARGTLIEGVDYYLPTLRVQQRLANFFEPYTDEENYHRRKYRYQSLKVYILAALGLTAAHAYLQRRPVAWCSNLEPPKPPVFPFWFKNAFHAHDVGSLRRGFEVFRQVCATCHSLQFIKFRHLVGEIYPLEKVKEIAAEYEIEDGPDDQGEMYTRERTLNDPFPAPYPNIQAARFANNGAVPPDLSQMASARREGPDYIFSLLTGYSEPPYGFELRPGLYFNNYFHGGSISMAPPLEDGMLQFEDGTPATVSQMAKDVASFIVWTSDPLHDERKNVSLKIVAGCALGAIAMTLFHRFLHTQIITTRWDFKSMKKFK